MNLFARKIAELINVKTIITFAVIYIFVRLVISGQVDAQASMQIVTMVIAFYFGTQYDKTSTRSGRSGGGDEMPVQRAVPPAKKQEGAVTKQDGADVKPEAEQ